MSVIRNCVNMIPFWLSCFYASWRTDTCVYTEDQQKEITVLVGTNSPEETATTKIRIDKTARFASPFATSHKVDPARQLVSVLRRNTLFTILHFPPFSFTSPPRFLILQRHREALEKTWFHEYTQWSVAIRIGLDRSLQRSIWKNFDSPLTEKYQAETQRIVRQIVEIEWKCQRWMGNI